MANPDADADNDDDEVDEDEEAIVAVAKGVDEGGTKPEMLGFSLGVAPADFVFIVLVGVLVFVALTVFGGFDAIACALDVDAFAAVAAVATADVVVAVVVVVAVDGVANAAVDVEVDADNTGVAWTTPGLALFDFINVS